MIRTDPHPRRTPRRASRWTAATTCALLAGAAGCAAPAPPQGATDAPDSSQAALPPPAAGPCDLDHREEAVAVARSCAARAYGGISLGAATASFSPRYSQPQMRGQPVPVPQYGWYVTFRVRTAIHDGDGGITPLAAHLMGTSIASGSPPPQTPPGMPSALPDRVAENLPPSHHRSGPEQPILRPGAEHSSIGVEQRDARTLLSPMQPIPADGDLVQPISVAPASVAERPGTESNEITGDLHLFVAVDGSALIL